MANLRTPPLPSHPSTRAASQAREAAAFDDNDDGFGLEWRKYPMEELFSALQTSPRGLASAGLLVVCGGNALESKKQSKILAFLPLSVEAAVVAMVVGLARGGGQVAFGYALLALLAVDFAVGYAERKSAEESTASTRGDTSHNRIPVSLFSENAVSPYHRIRIPVSVSPYHVTIKVDKSVLTGNALPAAKGPGDAVYAGSSCADAEGEASQEELKCLMRRLAALRREGEISEDTVQRCRDLLGVEPVSEELSRALVNYLRDLPSDD
ncbi:hypothetical protein QYE76_064495 [Lolium multiflorum]|uniref:Uncharacterized protein n=1 Tax=Lolium multiflorum TaxID=4521 RepID=A0AAD8S7K1_LOLMU|nr:hypothetical protein QYE76_064495 [Lolium multiflorum]